MMVSHEQRRLCLGTVIASVRDNRHIRPGSGDDP